MKWLKRFWTWITGEEKPEDIHCPVCGYYCIGKGGVGCINKLAIVVQSRIDKLRAGITDAEYKTLLELKEALDEPEQSSGPCTRILERLRTTERLEKEAEIEAMSLHLVQKGKWVHFSEIVNFVPHKKQFRDISKRMTVKTLMPLNVYGPRNPIVGHFVRRSPEWRYGWPTIRKMRRR